MSVRVSATPAEAPALQPARSARPLRARLGPVLALLLGALVVLALVARTIGAVEAGLIEGDDFTNYWNGATAVADGQTPYGWLTENRLQGLPDYVYPPLLALLLAPLTHVVDYTTARWAWLVLSTASLVLGTLLVGRATGIRWRGPEALALAGAVGVVPSALLAVGIGQLSPLLVLLLAVMYAGASGPGRAGALAVAVGTHLKTIPALLGGYLLLRGRWRECAMAVLAGVLLLAASIAVLGWAPHWAYLTQVVPAQSHWFGGPFNVSLHGVITRLLVDNDFAVPIVAAPLLARAALVAALVAVLALTAWAVRRAPADRAGEQAAIAICVAAMLLVSPINGNYNLVLAVIPLAVLIKRAQDEWPSGLRWLLVVAILLSLPVEYAGLGPWGPPDVSGPSMVALKELPWRQGWGNLLTTGPFWGLLALWALLFRRCTGTGPLAAASRQSAGARADSDSPAR